MNGFCDVPGCTDETFKGWRPLTERHGRQICRIHWNRHKDSADEFSLFDAFGFKRPERIPKQPVNAELCRSVPRALPPEPPKEPEPAKVFETGCRACGKPREPGHTYCLDCGKKRRTESNRRR